MNKALLRFALASTLACNGYQGHSGCPKGCASALAVFSPFRRREYKCLKMFVEKGCPEPLRSDWFRKVECLVRKNTSLDEVRLRAGNGLVSVVPFSLFG